MTVRFSSVAFQGFEAVPVEVEVQKSHGLFGQVSMVGLPSHGVRESRDRVRAAVQASDFSFPQQAMIINFAPGDLKKEGSFYDLPIALGILASSGIIEAEPLRDFIILGELALVDPAPRSATAVAGPDCTLVRVDREAFDDLVRRVPGLALEVMKVMARRLRRSNPSGD